MSLNFVADWQHIRELKVETHPSEQQAGNKTHTPTSTAKAVVPWSNSTPRANTMVTNTRALMRLLRYVTAAPSSSQGTPMVELSTRHGISGTLIPVWTDHPNSAARSVGANYFSPTPKLMSGLSVLNPHSNPCSTFPCSSHGGECNTLFSVPCYSSTIQSRTGLAASPVTTVTSS